MFSIQGFQTCESELPEELQTTAAVVCGSHPLLVYRPSRSDIAPSVSFLKFTSCLSKTECDPARGTHFRIGGWGYGGGPSSQK